MKNQLRLIGEDLFAFHAQLSGRCWAILSTHLQEGKAWGAYRSLRRRLRALVG